MRNLGLDILRLIAVVLVLGRHLRRPPEDSILLGFWRTGGWIGVDLFFVLSGFLVSGLLFREFIENGGVNLKRFLIRRGLKIYPPFYLLLLFTVSARLLADEEIRVKPLFGELLFLQNYLGGLWNHTWSLAVEEHFYLGISLLCLLVLRDREGGGRREPFRIVPTIFFTLALLCLFARVSNLFIFEAYSHKNFLFGTHIRIDSLMFGVLISYLWHFRNLESRFRSAKTWLLVTTGALCLLPAFLFPLEEHKWVSVFGVIPFYLGSGILLIATIRLKSSGNRALVLAGTLGAASYSIYLWHMPIATWGWDLVTRIIRLDSYIIYFLFYIFGSLAFGYFMSRVIEIPTLRVRERLFPKMVGNGKVVRTMADR